MRRVLIAGGGLAGGAAACMLAQGGAAVRLVERESGPHDKICGEFLSTEAQGYLAQLGLQLGPLGGHIITHMRLVRGAAVVTAKLPFQGLGLSRKVLDEALLLHAQAQGATLLRGQTIRNLDGAGSQFFEELAPDAIFLATGKHELHGVKRRQRPPNLVGFKMYFALAAAQSAELSRHVELLMFAGGYAGLQMVEGGQANFCLLIDPARLKRAGGKFSGLLAELYAECPHLKMRLARAAPLLGAPLTIARVPYGFVYRGVDDPPDLFRLGDQAAVIQSFTGDGMSIALHSAMLAAGSFLRGQTSDVYRRQLAGDVSGQISRASWLYRLISLPLLRPALFQAARAWPASLGVAAGLTRVPAAALKPYRISNTKITSSASPRPPP